MNQINQHYGNIKSMSVPLTCKYICMQVCIYVAVFVLPASHNLLQGYFNNEAFQLHLNDSNIGSQKIPLLGAYGKFECSLPPNYATLCFMISSKHFFSFCDTSYHEVYNMQTSVILTLVNFFQNSPCCANGQFTFLSNRVQGQVEIPSSQGNCKFCYGVKFLLGFRNLTRSDFEYSNLFQT